MTDEQTKAVKALRDACERLQARMRLLTSDAFYNGMITSNLWQKNIALSDRFEKPDYFE